MATATFPVQQTKRPGVLYPHAQWWFLAAMASTWLGFSQTYFRVIQTEPLLHHVHGALMGGWIALLVVQPVLYQRGRIKLHRTLGRWGVYLLLPAIVVCGYLVERSMLRHAELPRFIVDQLSFLDITTLFLFPAFVALAVVYGRNVHLHARYIVCTVLLLMPPAWARALFFVPGMDDFPTNVNVAEGLVVMCLLALLVLDWRRGKVWLPYPMAAGTMAALAVAANFAHGWTWFQRVTQWIAD